MSGLKTILGWLGAVVTTSLLAAQDAAAPTSYSTSVRSLATSRSEAPTAMPNQRMAARNANGPTLPGGKLPQYQFDHHRRELTSTDKWNDARLRFLLALPGRPLLIEATLTIDGQPFEMARELRIQQLLEELKRNPEPMPERTPAAASVSDSATAEKAPATESKATDSAAKTPEATKPSEKENQPSKDPSTKEKHAAGDGKGEPKGGEKDGDKKDGEDKPSEENKPEAEKPKVNPPSAPAYALPANVLERLRRQVKATGNPVSADELRWLLTNWIDGPTVLLLKDHFQQFRANERPVFHILDRDRDGVISAEELAQAVKSFEECDLNRNDIVEYTELERSAKDPRRKTARAASAGRWIFLLPDQKTAAETYSRLAEACASGSDAPAAPPLVARFDINADGQFDAAELKALHEATPDLRVTVAFNSKEPTKSQLKIDIPPPDAARALAAVSVLDDSRQTGSAQANSAQEGAIVLLIDGQSVEFSAVQDAQSDQISLGVVNDGYPLLAEIDPNDDGQFTIRELRTLIERLKQFDRDKDGALSGGETQATIRVCFGLGPTVHRELARLRRVNRNSRTLSTPGPDWFIRMDRNKDNDVSRKEFPGTDEQFQKLDADGDLLISAEEARNSTP